MQNVKKQFISVGRSLKEKQIKLTNPRKAIISSILESKNIFTPEEIFIKSVKLYPDIGIATVYRTIKLLEEIKLLDRGYRDDGKPVYKLAPSSQKLKEELNFKEELKSLENRKARKRQKKTAGILPVDINSEGNDDRYFEVKNENLKKEIKLEELVSDISNIDRVILKHENSKGNLIQMLIDFQQQYNWLPKHVLFYVGKKLDVPLTQIYSIASFYTFFNLEPKGKYQVVVCAGTACHVRGSMSLLQRITSILKIKPGGTTPDYRFSLDTVNCLGCCALGPVMMFDGKYYSNPPARQLEKLFESSN